MIPPSGGFLTKDKRKHLNKSFVLYLLYIDLSVDLLRAR